MCPSASGEALVLPGAANFVSVGRGPSVVLLHGLAASLHDWDFLMPELANAGYRGYALDLLGHGDSLKPNRRDYRIHWMFDHFVAWLEALNLAAPVVIVGHSLGGYLALEFARRFPARVRALVLISPYYARQQLSAGLRLWYRFPVVSGWLTNHTPLWLLRGLVDVTSLSIGHSAGGAHSLSPEVRIQTAIDYRRTAAGAYNVLSENLDELGTLPTIACKTLVVWGDRDRALAPPSFSRLVKLLPHAVGASAATGHVPHQSLPAWVNNLVLDFLKAAPT